MTNVFDELLNRAQPKRAFRAASRPIQNVNWNPNTGKYTGTCESAKEGVSWHPSITITDTGRSFYCNCPDHIKNARTFGPCKHVISLAMTLKG